MRSFAPVFNFNPIPFFLPNQSLARLAAPEVGASAPAPLWVTPHWEQLVVDQELAKELTCGICLQLLTMPRQCMNGHLFCNECIVASIDKRPECPLCRCAFTLENIARNLIVEKHLRELKMYCRHTFSPDPNNPSKLIHDPVLDLHVVLCNSPQEGCQELLTADSREAHESACPFAWELCRFNTQCGRMRRRSREAHELTCPSRPVPCKHCQNPIPEEQINEHLESCPEILEGCEHCHKDVKRRMLKGHWDGDCVEFPVKCEYADCEWKVRAYTNAHYNGDSKGPRRNNDAHLAATAVDHLAKTKQHFEKSLASLQEQYSKLLEAQSARIAKLESALIERGVIHVFVCSNADIIETKIVWKIREFPHASKEKVLQSEPFLIGDFTWFLVLFPNGDISDARGWCSVFLHVEPEDLPRGKAVTTDFSLTVLNQKIPSASIRREFASTFPLDDAEGCGDRRLIMASRLTEESGFLRKGTLIIELNFSIRRQAWVV